MSSVFRLPKTIQLPASQSTITFRPKIPNRLPTNNTNGLPIRKTCCEGCSIPRFFMIRRSLTEPKSNGFSCSSFHPPDLRLFTHHRNLHNVQSFHLETDLQREISVIRFIVRTRTVAACEDDTDLAISLTFACGLIVRRILIIVSYPTLAACKGSFSLVSTALTGSKPLRVDFLAC
ncbi:hypothetical protein PGT21_001127 [Puccinia graminis f. sp. tritici]|uniref:Uncharacterized protein n=1 Tax=Puccinia graminis f. sp. tritici TaxID=56615 RepID=A0A5B0P4E1_PUCGR|nr:hypothetical protein PGT21_001127 [Puccinia graminis f. sp. tritici]